MINNEDYQEIVNHIRKNFDTYFNKYDFEKYSLNDYKTFQKEFSNLNSENTCIEEALKWKWGHAGKNNYPKKQQELVREVQLNWKDFSKLKFTNPKDTFEYWKKVFNRNTVYITTVYITHLIHYKEIPIIDQHNFRAMNNYIKTFVDNSYLTKKKPSNWEDLILLKKFITNVSKIMEIDKEKLDKYLMMYGKEIK